MLTYNIKYLFTQKSANNASYPVPHPPNPDRVQHSPAAIDFYIVRSRAGNMFTFAQFTFLNNIAAFKKISPVFFSSPNSIDGYTFPFFV